MFTFDMQMPFALHPREIKRLSLAIGHHQRIGPRTEANVMRREDGIAVVPISGILIKEESKAEALRSVGFYATSYQKTQAYIEIALGDRSVKQIHLHVASPGGWIDGVSETADTIYQARQNKPITATIEDLCCSAAYWLTSQALEIRSHRTAEIGSIGVYTVYCDSSAREAARRTEVLVIRSGEHKGMGVKGAVITQTQLEAVQENVDILADYFQSDVARGRRWQTFPEHLGTGRLWVAEAAQQLRLIDEVE